MIRILDFSLSFLAIIILFPLSILLIFILRFSGEGEIFFIQRRIGTIKNDSRILPFGHFLRRSKINELPQLINILKGEMSFIGPRPLTLESFNSYPDSLKPKLKHIKPGLSGLASLLLRNEEEILSKVSNPKHFHSNTLAPFKAETEVWYYDKRNLANYFFLIFLTIFIVLKPKTKILSVFFKDKPKMPQELKALINS